MKIVFNVKDIFPAEEKHGKTFYPFSVKEIENNHQYWVFNASKEIPKSCKKVEAELYLWREDGKYSWKIGRFEPLE